MTSSEQKGSQQAKDVKENKDDGRKKTRNIFDITRYKSESSFNPSEESKDNDKYLKRSKSDIAYKNRHDKLYTDIEKKEETLLVFFKESIKEINSKYPRTFHEIMINMQDNSVKDNYRKNNRAEDIYGKKLEHLNKKYHDLYQSIYGLEERAFQQLAEDYNRDKNIITNAFNDSLKYEVERNKIIKSYVEEKSSLWSEASTVINKSNSWMKKYREGVEIYAKNLFEKTATKKRPEKTDL